MNSRRFRKVLSRYPTGVVVVTALNPDGAPVAMTVGSFGSASLEPPLVSFLPRRESASWAQIRASGRFCVNVLGQHQEQLCRTMSRSDPEKFAEIDFHLSALGSPVLPDVVAFMDCEIIAVHPAGDHDIVLGQVHELDTVSPKPPLLFFGGGYGAFSSLSGVAAEVTMRTLLNRVDSIRHAMESLSEELGQEVIAVARQGAELVFLAAAGATTSSRRVTRLGHRVPFIPPVGGVFAAWGGAEARRLWLSGGPGNEPRESQTELVDMLARIDARGYVLALGHQTNERLEALSAALPADADPNSSSEFHSIIGSLGESYNAASAESSEPCELHYASAPVFNRGGTAEFGLTVYGPAGLCSAAERTRITRSLVHAARSASMDLQRVTETSSVKDAYPEEGTP